MDFELVKPTLPQASGRASQDSSLATRDPPIFDSTKLDSPGLQPSGGDDASLLSSAPPKSPMSSTDPSAPAPESPTSMDAHRQRELKWMAILPSTPPSQARKSKKVKRLLLEGVPSSVRYLVWCHLTDSKARALPGVYAQLGKRPRVPAFADIGRSVKTCFPDQTQLHSPQGPLVSLLQAYLSMVPDIQYSSGLTAIAGHLLLLSPEEDAFWIFVSMMDAHLRPYFSANTIQVEVDSALLSKAIESNDAGVGKKMFVSLGILPSSICRPWFSTLFVGSLPVEFLHRIWDLFLYEGVTFLFRVGLALTQCVRHLLLQATSEEAALEYLAHPPLACLPSTADAFISQALSMKLKDDDVRKQRVKMEAQVKRQTQVRTLSTNGVSGMQTASISLPKS
ncbi:RabGAP TBC [Hygrophoropsis aurantiaca]|uniref:RabGAP TBC n=1 Tax=Hygrophoropsis aurantiaca TaxID=72124 RepID=A0ACB7ZWL6_9AGAM|nr:RabGAP TBC [Hygrophoropsis aurantiaca]